MFSASFSRVLRPGLHLLLLSGKAAVLHGSGPRSQLASLRHGSASLQRHDDRFVPDLRLQTPLARYTPSKLLSLKPDVEKVQVLI